MKILRHLISILLVICLLVVPAIAQSNDDAIANSSRVNTETKKITIDPLSTRPLYLIQVNGDQVLGTATGFIVQKGSNYYLITNWHVVSGRHPETNQVQNQLGLTPDAILIWYHGKQLGSWVKKKEDLYGGKRN